MKEATKVVNILGCKDCHAAAQGWGHWDEHNKENTFERNREVEDAFTDVWKEKYTVKVDGDLEVYDDDFYGSWEEVHKTLEGTCGICYKSLGRERFRMQLVRKPKADPFWDSFSSQPVCRSCGM